MGFTYTDNNIVDGNVIKSEHINSLRDNLNSLFDIAVSNPWPMQCRLVLKDSSTAAIIPYNGKYISLPSITDSNVLTQVIVPNSGIIISKDLLASNDTLYYVYLSLDSSNNIVLSVETTAYTYDSNKPFYRLPIHPTDSKKICFGVLFKNANDFKLDYTIVTIASYFNPFDFNLIYPVTTSIIPATGSHTWSYYNNNIGSNLTYIHLPIYGDSVIGFNGIASSIGGTTDCTVGLCLCEGMTPPTPVAVNIYSTVTSNSQWINMHANTVWAAGVSPSIRRVLITVANRPITFSVNNLRIYSVGTKY